MNDKKRWRAMKKVVHQADERPKTVRIMKKVVHQANERPKSVEDHEKGRSSSQ
jgi:hypothetical protein